MEEVESLVEDEVPHNDIPEKNTFNDLDSEQTLPVPEVDNDKPAVAEQEIAAEANSNSETFIGVDPNITGVNPMGMKTSMDDLHIIADDEISNTDD